MSHQCADEKQLKETLSKIQHTIVVLSGKGGVGKSSVAVNLAVGLALRGKKTGLLDTDLHGPSVPKMLGLTEYVAEGDQTHLQPASLHEDLLKIMSVQFLLKSTNDSVIWRGPLKHAIISQFIGYTVWGELDCLVIDSPPGTGDEPLSVVQTAHSDGAVIVTTPQDVATFDVRKSIDFCRKLNLPVLGIIENMSGFSCPHCHEVTNIFSTGGGRKLSEETGIDLLGTIPLEPCIVENSDKGKTIFDLDEKNVTVQHFSRIIDSILKKIS